MNKFDFIEIGTSDFRTLAHTVNGTGISVEPVKPYFDNLPRRDGLALMNVAISDTEKQVTVYYCDPAVIRRRKLPEWLRGCNSIEIPHPTVKKYCQDHGIPYDELVETATVDCITIEDLFGTHSVCEVGFLKIDTEGHDYYIMKSLLEWLMALTEDSRPIIHKIQYESNSLLTDDRRAELIALAEECGYTWHTKTERNNEDTILKLIAP